MLNIAQSTLSERYTIIPFTTSRPPKPQKMGGTRGYRSMFRGGIWSFCLSALATLWHVVKFPFAVWTCAPDIIQIQASDHQAFWEAAYYARIGRLLRKRIAMRIGGSFDDFYDTSSRLCRVMIRHVLAWPDCLIVQAGYWAEFLASCGRDHGIIVLPNSVPDELAKTTGPLDHSTPTCIFLAGIEAGWKGADDVIAAIVRLKKQQVQVRFHLIAVSGGLRRRMVDEGIAGQIEVDDFLDRDAVLVAMRKADIFLLPSHGEGFPNSLLEAMAIGLAAIVTPVGAIPEIVGRDGALTVPVKNPEALAGAIRMLAADSALRRKIADAGQDIVSSRYTHTRVLPILDGAWQSLLEHRS
jgi:glycosyltransferase involved in cell wall biosynthesis